jgi:hypothetical protein
VLYRPDDFERVTDEAWDEARIHSAIREIVADTDAALRGPKLLWRADDWDRWRATSPLKDLFVGAAGVLWALADLREREHAETELDLGDLALCVLDRYRTRPDLASWTDIPEPRESSLLSGEAGILLVAFRLAPSRELADALHIRVRENVHNEADEIMWGSPGTLIAARLMLAWTGEACGVGRERGCSARPAGRARTVDAVAARPDSSVPRAGARAHGERAVSARPPGCDACCGAAA